MSHDLTLHETADELGVHYMTVYRYVRTGMLEATKPGGTWQVTPAALDRFRAGRSHGPAPVGRRAPWAARLEARLLAGDAAGAWAVVEAALTSGTELEHVYLDVLTPALVGIGERWESGEIDVADEHRASVVAARIVGRLGPRCSRRGRSRGAVVVGAAPGELHSLPVAILGDLLRLRGWEVSDLGADVPRDSFRAARDRTAGAVAVGVSITIADHLEAASEVCASLRASDPGLLIVLGGRAIVDDEQARELGADASAAGAAAFSDLLARRS